MIDDDQISKGDQDTTLIMIIPLTDVHNYICWNLTTILNSRVNFIKR